MTTHELRIGNWIVNPFGTFARIDEIHKDAVKVGSTVYPLIHCKKIKLTEELLLKCGFEEYMSASDLRISINQGVLMQFHFGINQLECWIGDEISKTDVVNLHQLQNLYFSLVGEELNIEL